jgi:hypothetical protein
MRTISKTLKTAHAVIMYVRIAFCRNGLYLESWAWFQA